eukprot:5021778-Alexandrium_andersonii.AAC.1
MIFTITVNSKAWALPTNTNQAGRKTARKHRAPVPKCTVARPGRRAAWDAPPSGILRARPPPRPSAS